MIGKLPLRALVLLWASRTIVAGLVTRPLATAILSTGVGSLPAGDAALFSAGGSVFAEITMRYRGPLSATLQDSAALAVALSLLLLLPVAMVMLDIQRRERGTPKLPPPELLAEALRLWPRFSFLGGLATLTQVALGTAAFRTFQATRATFGTWFGAAAGDVAASGWIVLGVFAVYYVGLVRDLARAEALEKRTSPWHCVGTALRATRSAGKLLLRALLLSSAAACLLALSAGVSTWLDVSQPGEWRLAAVTVWHQATVCGLTALQILWLAGCVRHQRWVTPWRPELPAWLRLARHPSHGETPERSDEQRDPS